ncbi:MAG: hypothetical protein PHS77_05500 [Gallionellaceae bacterium]|nr:hypothetical protein [Gallionellaceae bacterium]
MVTGKRQEGRGMTRHRRALETPHGERAAGLSAATTMAGRRRGRSDRAIAFRDDQSLARLSIILTGLAAILVAGQISRLLG